MTNVQAPMTNGSSHDVRPILGHWDLVIGHLPREPFAIFSVLIFKGLPSMMPYDVSRSHAGATGLASP
jgi:hypothetical protein